MQMDMEKRNGKSMQVDLPMNIAQGQYVFSDAFDPALCSNAQFNDLSSHETTSNTQATVIAPFHAIATSYDDLSRQNANISLVPTSEITDNCITYSNVIFVPTITHDGTQLNHIVSGDTIELVNHDSCGPDSAVNDSQTYKYILSSDPRFVNTFVRTNDIGNSTSILGNASTSTFIEQTTPLITTVSHIHEDDIILNGIANNSNQLRQEIHNVGTIDQNQIAVQMHTENDQEVLMQDESGQLYRQVQNIFVNGTSMCPNDLLPLLSTPVDLADPEYVEQSMSRIQNTFSQREHLSLDAPFQLPVNILANSDPIENIPATSKSVDNNLDMQQVEFIINGYKNTNSNLDTDQYVNTNDSNLLDEKPNYHENAHDNSSNQHSNLLESTMSTLLAAVNDITAREREEQFQQYLNTSKNSDNSLDYYSTSGVENIDPTSIYTNPTTTNATECPKEMPKMLSLESITNELFPNGCDSQTDEYVDINEMEFIQGQKEKKVLMRTKRKKTTKRKEDALLVVDKFVPSRALASLPTSYLYFETINFNGPKQTVFAKREIPVEMKFGPFVGDTKTLNKHDIKKYKTSHDHYPLLFLNQNIILDVGNEETSNWMRFVRLANKYSEQNLLLCVIDSQLFFKCCKLIGAKHELRVGYSREYAQKYHLEQLQREKSETPEYQCKKCDERLADQLQTQQNDQKIKETKSPVQLTRTTPTKNGDANSPSKSKDRLNTGAIRMRKLALSKNARTTGPIVRYACCYCSKVFSKFVSYKKHTNIVHSVNIEHKRVTMDPEHKRLTVEDSVEKNELLKENTENGNIVEEQWFVCQSCQKPFESALKLEQHRLDCCAKESLAVQCHICQKQLQTPSALSMHIKMHNSTNGFCKCPFCAQQYQSTTVFKEHVKSHMINGTYQCPSCEKEFPEYSSIRKHIRMNHSTVRFVCHLCGKNFKTKYKLKDHSLSHSDVKEFSCADCDKQFKRKDKLREHILKVHVKENSGKKGKKTKSVIKDEPTEVLAKHASTDDFPGDEEEEEEEEEDEEEEQEGYYFQYSDVQSTSNTKVDEMNELPQQDSKKRSNKPRFQPKVLPTEYERFIYKCQHCLLGFKRRGMLVNHMAKRHPDIRIDSIQELNLPILKTERCFYCSYCEKVYKSSSKRKAHILKNHPGQQLPMSTRCKSEELINSIEPNPSFSKDIGSVTTNPHQCQWCHKQYASRGRLLQHKRKEHSTEMEESFKNSQNDYFKDLNMIMDSHTESQFQSSQMQINPSIEEYMKFNEMHETEPPSVHRFHHMYEPENRLLELSSAALETFRDDYSFLSDSDVHVESIQHSSIGGSRVDVNFKMVGEDSNCDLNSLPQLFEEIDYMSLKPANNPP